MLAKGKKVAVGAAGSVRERHPIPQRAISRWSAPTARSRCSRPRARAKETGRKPRHQGEGRHAADVPERRAHRRSRDRSRHRQRRPRHLHGGRRLRQHARPDDRRGPGAGLARQRLRPGADWRTRSTTRQRATRDRLVHGLRHAARARHAGRIARGDASGAGDHQPARRQGHRRGRHHGGDRRGDERDLARHPERRRRPHGDAGDAGEGVGGVPEGGRANNNGCRPAARSGDPSHYRHPAKAAIARLRGDDRRPHACEMNFVFM